MTSWSGGVRTGGWRVKNRSKFSAFRPHYERGRKELVVGGKKQNKSQNKTELNRTGCGFPPIPSLSETQRGCLNDQEWEQCKMQNSHDLWNVTLGSHPLSAIALRSVLVSFWEVRKCMTKAWDGGASSMWHVPNASPTLNESDKAICWKRWIKMFPIFNGCQMSNNDPFTRHPVSSIFIAADPLKCHPAALDQGP